MNLRHVGKDGDALTFVLCVMVFIVAVYSLVTTPMEMDYILDIVSFATLVLAPVLVLLNPRKTPQISAGIFALAVSVYNITLSIIYFELEANLTYFIMGSLYAGLGLILMVSALMYIRGASKNVGIMIYAAACSMGVEIFFFAFYLHSGGNFFELLELYAGTSLVTILANISVITLLSAEGIKRHTLEWRMDTTVSDAKTILGIDPSSFMYREDMEHVLAWFENTDRSEYSDRNVVSEICVPLISPNMQVYNLAFQRYSDGRAMVLVFDNGGSFAKGSTICVNTAFPNREEGYGRVRFYGDRGVFINILVKDPEPKKKWMPLRKMN